MPSRLTINPKAPRSALEPKRLTPSISTPGPFGSRIPRRTPPACFSLHTSVFIDRWNLLLPAFAFAPGSASASEAAPGFHLTARCYQELGILTVWCCSSWLKQFTKKRLTQSDRPGETAANGLESACAQSPPHVAAAAAVDVDRLEHYAIQTQLTPSPRLPTSFP